MNFKNLEKFIDSLPTYGIPRSDIIVYRDHKELYRHKVGVRDTETGEPLHFRAPIPEDMRRLMEICFPDYDLEKDNLP